jgi:alkylhydroperoxidase family enzyme
MVAMDRHMKRVAALRAAVFESPGRVEPEMRQAVGQGRDVPELLRAYVDKVHRHAYEVTDEDVEALEQAGYSQDQLFEITVSAAVGAGLSRLERGLAALGKGE